MPRSLRLRLILGAALWVAVALTLAGVVLHQLFAAFVQSQVVERLEADLDQLAGRLEVLPDGRPIITRPLGDPLYQRPLSGLYWQVEVPGGVVLRSRSTWDGVVQVAGSPRLLSGGLIVFTGAGPDGGAVLGVARQVSHPDLDVPLRLVVASDSALVDVTLGGFARVLMLSLGVLALGLVAAVWAQVGFGLRPLGGLRVALAAIRAGWAERLPDAGPAEIRPLVDDLNALLAHNAAMVESAQVQAGNLAHALKTPLTVIGNEVSRPTPPTAERAAESAALIAQQVEAMRRHIDHHLARARAQAAGDSRVGTPTALEPSAARLVRALSRLHVDRGLVLAADVPEGLSVRPDRQTVEEILGNLLDNACKWATARVRLTALPASPSGTVDILVEDDGPGIPAARLDDVLRRGRRLDEATPGSGLGLAIVEDLVRLSGGSLSLDASPDLGGLRARVVLPTARPDDVL